MTGVGVSALASAIATVLPARHPDPEGPVAGKIFKIERGWGGEKLCYLCLASGTVRLRQYLDLPKGPERVTAIHLFEEGRVHGAESLRAGQIARVSGLTGGRIGDAVAGDRLIGRQPHFAPPTLETRVLAPRLSDKAALWLALNQMAEQDPLINLRRNEETDEVFVSLYGEVQKEVIQSTLLTDFGLEASFEESTVLLVEKPVGIGSGLQILFKEPNPFLATVGLRVQPRPPGAGNSFALEVDVGQMPAAFYRAVEETVFETLKQGIFGWQVIDCHVAMTAARHSSPASTAADFRHLTPWVLATALSEAQTVLCEPVDRFHLEAPAESLGGVLTLLAKSAAAITDSVIADGVARLEGTMRLRWCGASSSNCRGSRAGREPWRPLSIITPRRPVRRAWADARGLIRSTVSNICCACAGVSKVALGRGTWVFPGYYHSRDRRLPCLISIRFSPFMSPFWPFSCRPGPT